MSYKIELHPEALADFEASCEWYEERSEGLGAGCWPWLVKSWLK